MCGAAAAIACLHAEEERRHERFEEEQKRTRKYFIEQENQRHVEESKKLRGKTRCTCPLCVVGIPIVEKFPVREIGPNGLPTGRITLLSNDQIKKLRGDDFSAIMAL